MCSPGAACSDRWASRPPTEQNTTPTSTWNAWPTMNPGSRGCRTRLSNISGKRTTRAASGAAAPRPGPVRNDRGTMIRQSHPTPVMMLVDTVVAPVSASGLRRDTGERPPSRHACGTDGVARVIGAHLVAMDIWLMCEDLYRPACSEGSLA
jgi:hypothetical protein